MYDLTLNNFVQHNPNNTYMAKTTTKTLIFTPSSTIITYIGNTLPPIHYLSNF